MPSEQNNRILHLKASNWKVFKYSGRAEGWDFRRCSGHQAPKAYGKPKRIWALASLRLQKSHPSLHCFSQTQNTWKPGGMGGAHRAVSPLPSSMQGPSIAQGSQQESRALTLGPPGTALRRVRFTLQSHRHGSMVAYSTACKNQQSAKEWIALWLIWSRWVQTTVLQKQWTQEKICWVSSWTSKTFSNAKIQAWCQDTEAFCSLAESQIKQIKLCILPAFTHSFPNYQELLIVASSLVNLQVDLTDARCLWARSQVQNRATKGENPSLMCSSIKEESSNFQVKVNRSPIKGTLQRNRIQLRITMKMWK